MKQYDDLQLEIARLQDDLKRLQQRLDNAQSKLDQALSWVEQQKCSNPILNLNVSNIGLSVRTSNALQRADIHTIFDLTMHTYSSLRKNVKYYGFVSECELRRKMEEFGIIIQF